jgi:hypothetical protein
VLQSIRPSCAAKLTIWCDMDEHKRPALILIVFTLAIMFVAIWMATHRF